MRVALDAAPLLNARTGVGHYTGALLEHLEAADPSLEVTLFAVGRQRDALEARHVRRLRVPARLAASGWDRVPWVPGEALTGRVDVVHGTNFWVPPLRRRNGVVTIHDLTFLLYPEFCTPPVRRYRWILPKVLARCRVVITPSATVADQVAAELGVERVRIVVTPEGVRPGARVLGSPGGTTSSYVLFIGTQEPRKNLDRLIRAFAQLRDLDVRLILAGPAGWGGGDPLVLADSLGIAGRVQTVGYLPDRELALLLAGARAFVFPSLYEGFGLPPLEAMAAGVPVVAAAAGSLPEVLGDAPVWCDPLDVSSIADAVRRVVSDETVRAQAVERGRAQAARYTWEATAARTIDAYRMVAGLNGV
ncbi:MAG TPA: glycosyltransferase family 1 protein [Actinomycetota bacterium]|nr:glycosyltransferase family 1 protein [Actinomycetota bacterium]